MVLTCSYLWKGDFIRAVAHKEEVLRRMDPGVNIYLYGRALCMVSLAFTFLGRWDKALEEGRKAMAAAEETSDASQISSAASTISVVHNFKGDVSKAVEYGELAVRKAPTPMDKGWAEACLAWAWSRQGDPVRGVETLAPFVELAQAAHYVIGVFPGMHWLGEAYWLAGEHEKGRRTLEELKRLAERCGARYYYGSAHAMLATIAQETDPAGAAAHFGESIAVFRDTKAENDLALACAGYGRLHKRQGRTAEARRYLGDALRIFERLGTPVEPEKVREELAELPGSG
jgi:tetratricopeptide (TPR) repeat protein